MTFWPLNVEITSNVTWDVINPCTDWLSVGPINGENDGVLSVNCGENYSQDPRSCTITVESENISRIFTVEQKGFPWIGLDIYDTTVTSQAGTIEVTVSSNTSWDVSPQAYCEWVSVEPVHGEYNGTFTIIYGENTDATERCCTMYVYYEAVGLSEYVVFNICQAPPFVCGDQLFFLHYVLQFRLQKEIH